MIVWVADIALDGNHWDEYTFASRQDALAVARRFREHDLPIAREVNGEDVYWAKRDIEKTRIAIQKVLGQEDE